VVAEHPDAADEPRAFCRRLGRVIADELARLTRLAPTDRAAARMRRYRDARPPA
jgi:acetyl-CoA carboxylase carboxyl transferase subunit beta